MSWMVRRIEKDLAPFSKGIDREEIRKYFVENSNELLLWVKIQNNKLKYERSSSLSPFHERFRIILHTLKNLCKKYSLPSCSFLICLEDASKAPDLPIFTMCKKKGGNHLLFPDFEALDQRFQVIKGKNLLQEQFILPWTIRKDQLIWRGSGAQGEITSLNMFEKSRVRLCQLSEQYPHLIDAGFSFFIPQGLKHFQKKKMPWKNIFEYRFQIWIDGNAASYSNSGWRFLTGSTVLKEDSELEQWYFDELVPNFHFIPVKEKLVDLIDIVTGLQINQDYAQTVANKGNELMRSILPLEKCHEYFRLLLQSYGDLYN